MGLTIEYVEKTGKKLFGKKHFLGCFPSDLQPKTKRNIFSIIFNLSKHNEEGSHYIAIFANKTKILYFDSFGNKCDNKDILKFIAKNKKNRKYRESKLEIQNCDSNFCGYFCLGFILSQELNTPFEKFLKMFRKNLKLNDEIIIDYIISAFTK